MASFYGATPFEDLSTSDPSSGIIPPFVIPPIGIGFGFNRPPTTGNNGGFQGFPPLAGQLGQQQKWTVWPWVILAILVVVAIYEYLPDIGGWFLAVVVLGMLLTARNNGII